MLSGSQSITSPLTCAMTNTYITNENLPHEQEKYHHCVNQQHGNDYRADEIAHAVLHFIPMKQHISLVSDLSANSRRTWGS